METEQIEKMKKLIRKIKITKDNRQEIKDIKNLMKDEEYDEALEILQNLNIRGKLELKDDANDDEIDEESERNLDENEDDSYYDDEEQDGEFENIDDDEYDDEEEKKEESLYPEELSNPELEEAYISMLLVNPKAISMYYILYEDCYFENQELLNLYKSILFTEGEAYAPQIAKDNYNFAKENAETYNQKNILKEKGKSGNYDFEKTYVELMKLFAIRKSYLRSPIQETKNRIMDIMNYELYDKMTIQEVKDAIEQITATEKFKRAVLSNDITNFLITGESNLSNRISITISNIK